MKKYIFALLLIIIPFLLLASVPYRIVMPNSTYSAQLRGITGTRTAGITITGSYSSTFKAHVFTVSVEGRYDLYYDASGGSTYTKDTGWSGSYGKFIAVGDFSEAIDTDADNKVDQLDDNSVTAATITDSVISLSKMTQAAINYIGSGGNVVNNPDDVTIENSGPTTLGVKDASITSAKIASGAVTVANKTELQALTESRVGFNVYVQSNNTEYVQIDSTYIENGVAISSATTGKQWVTKDWVERRTIKFTDFSSDSTAITYANAFMAAETGGGVFTFPAKVDSYYIGNKTVTLQSNWNIDARGARIFSNPDLKFNTIYSIGDTNISIIGGQWYGSNVDDASGARAVIWFEDCRKFNISGVNTKYGKNYGMVFINGRDGNVSDCVIEKTKKEHGLNIFHSAANMNFNNITIKDCAFNGVEIFFYAPEAPDSIVQNLTFTNINAYRNGNAGFAVIGDTITDIIVGDSYFGNNTGPGVDIRDDAWRISFDNCIVENNGDEGFQIVGGDSIKKYISITDCYINNNTTTGISAAAVTNTLYGRLHINGNKIYDNGVSGVNIAGGWKYSSFSNNEVLNHNNHGVNITSGNSYWTITNNIIKDSNNGATTTADLRFDGDHSILALNHCIQTEADNNTYGIELETNADSNYVYMNVCTGHEYASIITQGGVDNILLFNYGESDAPPFYDVETTSLYVWSHANNIFKGYLRADTLQADSLITPIPTATFSNLTAWLRSDVTDSLTLSATGDSVNTWADHTGNGNDFTGSVGSKPVSFAPDSVVFYGTSQLSSSSTDFNTATGNFSVGFYFKVETGASGQQFLVSKRLSSTNLYYINYNATSNRFEFNIGDGTNLASGVFRINAEDGDFHSFVITFDRTNGYATGFYDGIQLGAKIDISNVTGSVSPAANITIGSRNGSSFFNGYINDFIFVSGIMTDWEIESYFKNLSGAY